MSTRTDRIIESTPQKFAKAPIVAAPTSGGSSYCGFTHGRSTHNRSACSEFQCNEPNVGAAAPTGHHRTNRSTSDESWMQLALSLATNARFLREVPVGAIVVRNGRILGTGFNHKEAAGDATQHAEIIAIKAASAACGNWRLSGCRVYVTLEPCLMCAGALSQARVDTVIYGASDPKGGAMGSLYQVHCDPRLNHQINVIAGVLAKPSQRLLQDFFRERRRQKAPAKILRQKLLDSAID